jgi:anthranilate phosphoribosyltransferase
MIKEAIAKVVRGDDLAEKEMEGTMEEVMTGKATPAQIGAFITALRIKGETVDEITGAARVMRAKAKTIRLNCGGGDDPGYLRNRWRWDQHLQCFHGYGLCVRRRRG